MILFFTQNSVSSFGTIRFLCGRMTGKMTERITGAGGIEGGASLRRTGGALRESTRKGDITSSRIADLSDLDPRASFKGESHE